MRVRTLIGAGALALAWLPSVGVAGAVGRVPVTEATTRTQSGTAAGAEAFQLVGHGVRGAYATSGQLGSGRWLLSYTHDDLLTHCNASGGTLTIAGTATFTRSDGAVLTGTVASTGGCPSSTSEPVSFTVDLTSGSRDLVAAHLVVSGTRSAETQIDEGNADVVGLTISGSATFTKPVGYWVVGETGSVSGFGGLTALGNAPTTGATHLEPTPDRLGYWIVDAGGHVFAFGDAKWLGNASALVAGETVTNLSATPSGAGYWLFTNRGRALPFGDAAFLGDMHSVALNGPVVGAVATPTGHGYYMVASDGGVFAFGDAVFRGSMGAAHLNRPVNGLVPTTDNTGYWLVASDGGVFAFHAPYLGSTGNIALNQPVVGMTRYGTGYLMVAGDGGLFNFSNEPFFGSLGSAPPADPIIGIAAAS